MSTKEIDNTAAPPEEIIFRASASQSSDGIITLGTIPAGYRIEDTDGTFDDDGNFIVKIKATFMGKTIEGT